MVKVHYDEGIATHIGPESCVRNCEVADEALTGESIGQPLSREISINPSADTFIAVEGNTAGRASASVRLAWRGQRPWHVWILLDGNREASWLAKGIHAFGPHREGEES